MAERKLPSNLPHFNKLLTEYSKRTDGMPVARARHAIGVVVVCSGGGLLSPESQGGHACLLNEPPDFGPGQPVLARRGDVLLAHYLLAHNQSGNMWNPLRQIVHFRLAATGHRQRWRATQTDALLEFEPIRAALHLSGRQYQTPEIAAVPGEAFGTLVSIQEAIMGKHHDNENSF